MTIEERIDAFSALGVFLRQIPDDQFQTIALRAANENPWFTKENVRMAINGVITFLASAALAPWAHRYSPSPGPKTVALVMAGNIPLVGFHDLLCVLISGHNAQIKLSSKDSTLTKLLIELLIQIQPAFSDKIRLVDQLKSFDAVIATGSDNSARYFDYYFGKYANIIRKNRTSIAVLTGHESDDELKALGTDIFSYFGLGCRNISKLMVPLNYDFGKLFSNLESFQPIINHHKYANNYDYQKSILLINQQPFLDNGFVLLQESDKLVSPISVVFYEYYQDHNALQNRLRETSGKIQCIVGNTIESTVRFGQAQFPSIDDYADNIDTMKFLSGL
jgi:hypothetical protein